MTERKRRVGIDIIGEATWGTHLCLFYQTQQQLIEILAPYFRAGIESNELCVWMVAEPLTVETARQALHKEKNLAPYLQRGQIDILDRKAWQTQDGKLNPEAMIEGWTAMERHALDQGFDGLRICGDMGWIEDEDWETINYYEGLVDQGNDQQHILALCAYSQEKSSPSQIFDLISNHKLGLIYRSGKWEVITSSEYGRVKEALSASEDRYQALVRSAHHHIFMLDQEGVYLESNNQVGRFGLENGEALVGMCLDDVFSQELAETYIQQMERVLATGSEIEFEHPMHEADGEHEFLVTLYPIYRYGEIQAVGGISRDITETKQAERAVRLAEERYRSIYENALEGIFQSTPNGEYLNVNPTMARIFGYTSAEEMITSIGGEIESRIYVDSKRRADFINTLLEKGVVTEFENQNQRKDGSIIWTHTNARAVYDGNERLSYFEGFLTDITERKLAEEALRESEDRHRDLVENLHEFICTHDLNGIILTANDWASKVLGYDLDEIVGKNLADFLIPESREHFPAYLEAIQRNGMQRGILKVKTRLGETRIWEYNNSLRTEGVFTPIVRGMAFDITERRQAEIALREAATQWQTTFDAVSDAICLLDSEQRILRCNQAMSSLCKKPVEELIGTPCYEIVHGTESAIVECPILRSRETHQRESLELSLGDRWFDVTVDPILENGRLVGATHILRDITEHKRSEEEVKAALAEKVVLLREVHHRVKNNLATISSLLELQARASQDAGVQSAFQESQQRIRSMTQIHEQLYRSDSLSHIDMSKYVSGLTEELRFAYSKGEIAVEVDVPQMDLTIDQAIPCGLIINELITNALKYAFPAVQVHQEASAHSAEDLHKRKVLVSMQLENARCRLALAIMALDCRQSWTSSLPGRWV